MGTDIFQGGIPYTGTAETTSGSKSPEPGRGNSREQQERYMASGYGRDLSGTVFHLMGRKEIS